ncbi:ATP-binding protein [Ideonella sp. A 288]|uniref:ATP-binding protein n=1 Tax=Ideonella sp. A 288 TaxID=1962181 RepID=UPI000B4B7F13|nr:ATP-binding protein [Ideonella sp. A 288]
MQSSRETGRAAPQCLWWRAVAVWVLGWAAMLGLDERIDLANMALVLVLSAAVAAIWSTHWAALAASAASVLAFNVAFVPPRGALTVDLRQHVLLLVTMLAVSWIVTLLVARLRWHAAQATAHALRADQMQRLGEALRAVEEPVAQVSALQRALSDLVGASTSVLLPGGRGDGDPGADPTRLVGEASPDEVAGLRLCLRDGRAMGPGSGRHEEQPAWYLPLRGLQGTHGAAIVRHGTHQRTLDGLLDHTQALCDQLGAALERGAALRAAAAAHEQAQAHALRNTLLSAISHDHRTPLATILGASSALHDQGERLSAAQRRQLAGTIVDEATQLSRLTDNTLQLARLGAVGLALQRDWESVEEMVGTVLRRVRQRNASRRVRARVEPGLPLLRCDAVLMVQLLDNLVDNALKHGGADAPIEVMARRLGTGVVIAVRDRGPGVPPAQRELIFDTFQRGERVMGQACGDHPARTGAGVGLALCRAIAQVHGGELRLRPRGHGGSSFEVELPVEALPEDASREVGDGAPS